MDAIDRIGSAFLRRILLRMKELGMSQTDLARRMNVSRPYITKVLHTDVNISFRTAAKLARALKMDFLPELRPHPEEAIAVSP
jgi:transcriptional regulator with XRE-family HTH domain